MSNEHPGSPKPALAVFSAPTPFIRSQVIKAAGCILLYFTANILLLISTAALATACIAGGIILMMTIRKVLIFVPALCLIILGAMLLLYLGFQFSVPKKDASPRMLLQPSEHPRLFSFIKTLAAATRTRFPKKIFAVPGMAATMGSQLEIGLGLVNSLNISELQMILARTLGRFSLPGMRLGNYISGLHQRIYRRLYENSNTPALLRQAGYSLALRPFSLLAIGIANSIQHLLKGLFGVVNRACLPLNREMEFYADAAGLRIAGSHAAIPALYRTEIGSHCMERCLLELPRLQTLALQVCNLYEVQRALIGRYAAQHHLLTDYAGLPVITETYQQTFVKSRVQFRSRSASLPGLEERIQRLGGMPGEQEIEGNSAWDLFNEPVQLQQTMSALIQAPVPENDRHYPVEEFIAELEQEDRKYQFPDVFRGYYDNRPFSPVTPACRQPLSGTERAAYSFDTLYTPDNTIRIRRFFRDRQDAETLQSIITGQIPVGRFEYDGQPYPAAGAPQLLQLLHTALGKEAAWLHEHDCRAFRFHYSRALDKGPQQAQALLEIYENVLLHQERAQQLDDRAARVMDCTGILLSSTDLNDEEVHYLVEMLDLESSRFKAALEELLQQPAVYNTWETSLQREIEHFVRLWRNYPEEHIPPAEEIEHLQEVAAAVVEQYNNYVMALKKAYLDRALELSTHIIVHEY